MIHNLSRGVIIKNNNLLVAIFNNTHFLPGGHIEENETPEDTLIRECLEEFSGEIKIIKKLDTFPHSFLTENNNTYNEVNNIYLCEYLNNTFPNNPTSNETNLRFKWVPINKLEEIKLVPSRIIKLINTL